MAVRSRNVAGIGLAARFLMLGGLSLMPIVMLGPGEVRRRIPGTADFSDGGGGDGERKQ